MEITATIKQILRTESVGNNNTQRRTLIVTEQGQYPKDIAIDFFGDKCAILDGFNQGESVTVGINIESKEYNGKWYTNVKAWKINKN